MLYNIFLSEDDVIMKKRILNITFAALFTAITAALSQAAIPTPFGVPLTLQTFAVALCGYVLGIKWGLASIITYILLGAFGVGFAEELLSGKVFDDFTRIHEDHAVGDLAREAHFVRQVTGQLTLW